MDEDDRGESKSGGGSAPIGPAYDLWEGTLEKLKCLNYEHSFCNSGGRGGGRKPFHRVHFVFPGANPSVQFDEFVELCSFLCSVIQPSGRGEEELFRRDQYDDPNTVVNKLMLALRSLSFDLSFPSQKLKTANGEQVCAVLDFLANKALESRNFRWGTPVYKNASDDPSEILGGDDDIEEGKGGEGEDEIEDEIMSGGAGLDDDVAYEGDVNQGGRVEASDVDPNVLDDSAHHMLHAQIDPIEWKTEVERVAPRLRALATGAGAGGNEWRAHVDQTVTSKGHIDKILGETKDDLNAVNRVVADELNRARTKEKYMNHQFSSLATSYATTKKSLQELESKGGNVNDKVSKMTNDLADITDKLDEMKENFESKDSGIHDTSPLVRMKAALQQIKAESFAFDLRIGVVSHSLLAARVAVSNRRRAADQHKHRHRHNKKGGKNKGAESKEHDAYISD